MLTIVLVEDNEAIVLGLEYLLKEEGYRLLAAEDVKSAREILAKEQPDLVLLDVALPDGTGFDLCREIKAKDLAPVIFLTARDEERDVVLGFDLGADDYVCLLYTSDAADDTPCVAIAWRRVTHI